MSLIGQYGNFENDLNKLMLQQKELFKLSSAPLIWYVMKKNQPSTDQLYGEITHKEYEKGIEVKAYFDNPTLTQDLVKMGIEIPEQIVCYMESDVMLEKFGEPVPLGTIMQVPHQRNQFYIVDSSLPYHASQRFFKYTQWILVLNKEQLEGRIIPPYLELDSSKIYSWITFGEHWKTEFLQDRLARLEQRQYQIFGDLDYFWQKGNFYETKEIGCFNGTNNYCNFGNNYNMGDKSFAISIFLKPTININFLPIINKGETFKINIENNQIQITIGQQNFTTNFQLPQNVWTQLCIVINRTLATLKIYKNASLILNSSLNNSNISNDNDFIIGKYNNNYYSGEMSNLRILTKEMTDQDVLVEYENLITRDFYNF